MRLYTILFVTASAAVSLCASTLEIYKDAAIYRFTPSSTFIGFAPKKSRAECGDTALALTYTPECPKGVGLCSLKSEIEALQLDIARSKQEMGYLDGLIEEASCIFRKSAALSSSLRCPAASSVLISATKPTSPIRKR